MKGWLAPLVACAALNAAPVLAQNPAGEGSPAVASGSSLQVSLALAAIRYSVPYKAVPPVWQEAQYGPFRVVAPDRVEMAGATDSATPAQFAAMLRNHPGVRRLVLLRCPGTYDDIANLKLGRMIREAGLATHVPANGSVRSGAVDLFLAGRERVIEDGAEFAVHSWRDRFGREAGDFAPGEGPNRTYLEYYRAVGMDPASARDFYAFTNSVPHADALWLAAEEMRGWVARLERPARPVLAVTQAAQPTVAREVAAVDLSASEGAGIALLDLTAPHAGGSSTTRSAWASLDSHPRL